MASSNQTMREASELLRRVSPAARDLARRQRRRRQEALTRRFRRVIIAAIGIVVGLAIVNSILSLATLSWLLMTVVFVGIIGLGMLVYPRPAEPSAEKLVEADLPALPNKTESWLAKQRASLPAPAGRALHGIAVRLEELRPQLQNLDPREPAAVEVRRLVGVELPELVEGYKRVPDHLRLDPGPGGQTPEKQLIDGLEIVEGEISRMTRQLAAGELDALATQGKYLELKYRGDDELAR
jgi:hypothetical protein